MSSPTVRSARADGARRGLRVARQPPGGFYEALGYDDSATFYRRELPSST